MKIIVKAKTNAKEEKVERASQATLALFGNSIENQKDMDKKIIVYKVSVKEPPIEGRANTAIINALANYFDIPKSQISLISGQISKQKVFEIWE